MNKKGFAISVVLYSLVILIVSIMYLLLSTVKNNYNTNKNLRNEIVNMLNNKQDNKGPSISYNLSNDTYNTNQELILTIKDTGYIRTIEYIIRKDSNIQKEDTIKLTGNIKEYELNFKNIVGDLTTGTWKIEVRTVDSLGNYNPSKVIYDTKTIVIDPNYGQKEECGCKVYGDWVLEGKVERILSSSITNGDSILEYTKYANCTKESTCSSENNTHCKFTCNYYTRICNEYKYC